MNNIVRKKILAKMLGKLSCTLEEYNTDSVSQERIDMFVKGIALLRGDDFTIKGQIKAYEKALMNLEINGLDDLPVSAVIGLKTSHKSMIKKLRQLDSIETKMSSSDLEAYKKGSDMFQSFHNTIYASGEDLGKFKKDAKNQEDIVLEIFKKHYKLTASEAYDIFGNKSVPLTSIRRAISNLVYRDKLVKLDGEKPEMKIGVYGKSEFVYQLK